MTMVAIDASVTGKRTLRERHSQTCQRFCASSDKKPSRRISAMIGNSS